MCVYVFFHVPKCAGTTIHSYIASNLKNYEFFNFKKASLKANFQSKNLEKIRFLSGHFLRKSMLKKIKNKNIKKIILLREPLSFHVSLYNYRNMKDQKNGKSTYSFNLHVKSSPDNTITHLILNRWLGLPWISLLFMSSKKKFNLVDKELSDFWYIGDYSDCDDLLIKLSQEMDLDEKILAENVSSEKAKKNQWKLFQMDTLSNVDKKLFLDNNKIDFLLWRKWCDPNFNQDEVENLNIKCRSFLLSEICRIIPKFYKRNVLNIFR